MPYQPVFINDTMSENNKNFDEETPSTEKESQLRVKAIENSIPSFVINSDHKIVVWNKAMEKVSGLSKEKMIGTTAPWKAFYPEKRDVLADIVVESGNPHEVYEHVEKSKDVPNGYTAKGDVTLKGEKAHILFTAAPLHDPKGEIIGAVENIQDITEIEEMEKKAVKAWRMMRGV